MRTFLMFAALSLAFGCMPSRNDAPAAAQAGVLTYDEPEASQLPAAPPPAAAAPRRSPVNTPSPSASPPPVPARPGAARLRVHYADQTFPVTVRSASRVLGVIDGPLDVVSISPPTDAPVRLVNTELFFDLTLPPDALRAGSEYVAALPAVTSAIIAVEDDAYTGLHVRLGHADVDGPFPVFVKRLAAGSQRIVFRWQSGPREGQEIVGHVALEERGHYLIRARPRTGLVTVQKIR